MMNDILKKIEEETGFYAFESSSGTRGQYVFYGTSDMYEQFKNIIGDVLPTGSIAYLIDIGESHIWSKFKKAWY